jgi:PAS domain S-box-containing protein
VAIQWYDEAGRLIFYNNASRRLFGWSADGALGKSLLELGFWDDAEETRFSASRATALAGQRVVPTEFTFRRPDGSEGFLVSTVFRVPLSDSDHCYVCMDVDLTETRRAAQALRYGEMVRALIYDLVADVIFYIAVEEGERFRFQSVNRAFLEATGLGEADVVGRLVDDVIPPSSLPLVKARYAEAIATGAAVTWDEVSTYPSGTKHGEVTVSPIYDRDGKCSHLVGSVHDVTERCEAERERREIEAQMHHAQRLQALGTLAGGIAHDFNNILTAFHCNLDVAVMTLGAEHRAYDGLVAVKEASDRATALVRQILTFSRHHESRREPLELRPVVEEALRLARVATRGAHLRSAFAAEVPPICGDATQVHQALMNLITNAAQALDGHGGIDVALDGCVIAPGADGRAPELRPGSYARLTVKDDGPGMDGHTLRRVFEPFFTTKPAGQGTGLGLAVVHGIVKGHGGVVTVHSELGKGTTFELFFPAAEQPPAAETSGAVKPRRGQRVLFVDDDEAIVLLARRVFARRGHRISAHSSSLAALREFESSPNEFDVVVADLAMPELDGVGLVREIRRIRPDVRIVVTSGSVRAEDVSRVQELGVSRIMQKPQSPADLAKLVELDLRDLCTS